MRRIPSHLARTALVGVALAGAAACGPPHDAAPVLTGTATAPRAAYAPGVTQVAVFNDPSSDGTNWDDHAIRDRVRDLIGGTVSGDTIRAAIYSLTDASVTTALLAAQGRNVRVYVVHSGHDAYGTQGQRLTDSLASVAPGRHVRCGTSTGSVQACISGRSSSLMHSKFFLFSRAVDAGATRTRVVAVTSANMTQTQAEYYNNLVITAGDTTSYAAFVRVFDDMYYHATRGKDDDYRTGPNGFVDAPGARLQASFFPRADSNGGTAQQASTDDVAISLSYVSYASGCFVKAAQANFTSSRLPVMRELIRLKNAGCAVQLAYSDMSGMVRDSLLAANVSLRKVVIPRANGDTTRIHSKYYVTYGGTSGSHRLFTGSHNWSGPALRTNDEVLLKLYEQDVIDDFLDDFARIWSVGTTQ